ncbi:unnamed protein product [Symbiodinium sp. CCMP2592]|nr:unnamed protein product [Symbiodinium sp. CCMP2592]
MGCCASASLASDPVEEKEPETPANVREAVAVDETHHKTVHERLRNLRELDSTTKVPFILIELTGEGDGEGEIEVTGKDEYGVYEAQEGQIRALNNFFVNTWGCDPLDPGDETEDTKVPFCSAQYRWPGYSVKGDDGLNNQGLMTMRLIDFMCGNLSWTLAVVNGGNVGENRDVRETQLIFKAPHPMNLVAPHLLVEVRSAGFIEICADLDEENNAILGSLDRYFGDRFKASLIEGHEDFCDRYYEAGEGIFKGSGGSLDSNFGLLCTDVCDVITTHEGWSLVACNTGNYGADGKFSEQQMIFRRDYHPLGDSKYLQVILNALGNIEVNGQHVREIHSKLDGFFRGKWKCERAGHFREGDTLCRRYTWDVSELNMLRATADVVTFFELQGWLRTAVGVVAAACLASIACEAFVAPSARPAPLAAPQTAAAAAPPTEAAGWGLAAAGLAVGAHAGLAVAFRARAARRAETKPAEKSKYVETVADQRLFEQVYLQYTSEYLKGPLYWHPDKLQGWLPDYPGTPMIKEGKYTSHVIGNLKAFSSNELAFLSMLFFGVGLYGNLQFNFYDPQWAKEIQVASQQQVLEDGSWCREQQLLFRPGKTEVGSVEPHVFIELYAGEGAPELFEDEETTQVLANQRIRLRAIGPGSEKMLLSPQLRQVKQEFASFVINYLGGERIDGPNGEDTFACNVFLCRGRFENNLAQWTMRLCDWMVDKLGWSFIVSSLCNMGDCGQNRLEQIIFRFDGDKRALPVSKVNNPSDEFMDSPFPDYWSCQEVLERQEVHKVRTCAAEEKESLQQLVDATFRRILTRDRVPDDDAVDDEEMPYRIEAEALSLSSIICVSVPQCWLDRVSRSQPVRAFSPKGSLREMLNQVKRTLLWYPNRALRAVQHTTTKEEWCSGYCTLRDATGLCKGLQFSAEHTETRGFKRNTWAAQLGESGQVVTCVGGVWAEAGLGAPRSGAGRCSK